MAVKVKGYLLKCLQLGGNFITLFGATKFGKVLNGIEAWYLHFMIPSCRYLGIQAMYGAAIFRRLVVRLFVVGSLSTRLVLSSRRCFLRMPGPEIALFLVKDRADMGMGIFTCNYSLETCSVQCESFHRFVYVANIMLEESDVLTFQLQTCSPGVVAGHFHF